MANVVRCVMRIEEEYTLHSGESSDDDRPDWDRAYNLDDAKSTLPSES